MLTTAGSNVTIVRMVTTVPYCRPVRGCYLLAGVEAWLEGLRSPRSSVGSQGSPSSLVIIYRCHPSNAVFLCRKSRFHVIEMRNCRAGLYCGTSHWDQNPEAQTSKTHKRLKLVKCTPLFPGHVGLHFLRFYLTLNPSHNYRCCPRLLSRPVQVWEPRAKSSSRGYHKALVMTIWD